LFFKDVTYTVSVSSILVYITNKQLQVGYAYLVFKNNMCISDIVAAFFDVLLELRFGTKY